MAPYMDKTTRELKKQRDALVEAMKTRPGMAFYERRLTELNKELNDLLRGNEENDRQKKAIKATNDIPTGNSPSITTPAANPEPTGREQRAQESASKVTRAQAEADDSQQLVKEAKARLDKTPKTNPNAWDDVQKRLNRREKDAKKKEAYLEKAKNQAAKALEYVEKGHAKRQEWQAKAESIKAKVDNAAPSPVAQTEAQDAKAIVPENFENNDLLGGDQPLSFTATPPPIETGSPLPVQLKRKAEDDVREDEEQLEEWMAERDAAKKHREECRERLKIAQEEKEAADSKYEELNEKIEEGAVKHASFHLLKAGTWPDIGSEQSLLSCFV